MTGSEHYREAERLMDGYKQALSLLDVKSNTLAGDVQIANLMLNKAQVHATLALAAATASEQATAYDEDSHRSRGWSGVA